MNRTVEDQVRAYFKDCAESWPTRGADVVVERAAAAQPIHPTRPGPRRVPGWVYGLAAAAAVLIVVGGTMLLIRPTEETPPVVTEVPQPTVTTAPHPNVSELEWQRVAIPHGLFSAEGTAWLMVPLGPRLVLLGTDLCDENGAGERVAAVWTSEDGFSWSRVPHDDDFHLGARRGSPDCLLQGFRHVTVGGPGLVAVGETIGPEQALNRDKTTKATVWTSPDGINWSRLAPDGDTELDTETSVIDTVFPGGPGLVAIGRACGPEPGCADRMTRVVWTSTDGLTWDRIADTQTAGPSDVIVGGPGFIGVSSRGESAPPAFWTSTDGLTWTLVPESQVEPHECFQWLDLWAGYPYFELTTSRFQLAASESGFTALGKCDAGHPGPHGAADEYNVIWTSQDGQEWSATRLEDEMAISSVVGIGSGFLAVGSIEPDQFSLQRTTWPGPLAEHRPAAWFSVGGRNWTPIDIEEASTQTGWLQTATAGGPGLVAFGLSAEGPTLWVATQD